MKKYSYLLKAFQMLIAGAALLSVSSYLYLYFNSPLYFVAVFLVATAILYESPLLFQIIFRAKKYKGQYSKDFFAYAQKLGVNLKDIYIRKSSSSNAFAVGFANNKCVVFNSNTLENHSYEELKAVMTHEVGHHLHNDPYLYELIIVCVLIVTDIVIVSATKTFQLSGSYILLFSLLFSIFLTPAILAISRWREGGADTFAFNHLKKPSVFAEFFKKSLIAERGKGRVIPKTISPTEKLLLTHPWIYDRINRFK